MTSRSEARPPGHPYDAGIDRHQRAGDPRGWLRGRRASRPRRSRRRSGAGGTRPRRPASASPPRLVVARRPRSSSSVVCRLLGRLVRAVLGARARSSAGLAVRRASPEYFALMSRSEVIPGVLGQSSLPVRPPVLVSVGVSSSSGSTSVSASSWLRSIVAVGGGVGGGVLALVGSGLARLCRRLVLGLVGGLAGGGADFLGGFFDVEEGAAFGDLGAGGDGGAGGGGCLLLSGSARRLGLRLGLVLVGFDVGVGVVLAAVDVAVGGGVGGGVLARPRSVFVGRPGSSVLGCGRGADCSSAGASMSKREPPSGISVPGVWPVPEEAGASSFASGSGSGSGPVGPRVGLGLDVGVGVVLAAVDGRRRCPRWSARWLLRWSRPRLLDVEEGSATEALGAGVTPSSALAGASSSLRLDVGVGVVLAAVDGVAGVLGLGSVAFLSGVVATDVEQRPPPKPSSEDSVFGLCLGAAPARPRRLLGLVVGRDVGRVVVTQVEQGAAARRRPSPRLGVVGAFASGSSEESSPESSPTSNSELPPDVPAPASSVSVTVSSVWVVSPASGSALVASSVCRVLALDGRGRRTTAGCIRRGSRPGGGGAPSWPASPRP